MLSILEILVGLGVAAIWGGNFLFAKIGLAHLPPFLLLSLRFLLVSIILLPFVKRSTISIKNLVIIATTLGILHHGLLFLAIRFKIDLGMSIIILQSSVPISSLLSMLILGEHISRKTAIGMLIAIIGIIIVAGDPHVNGNYLSITLAVLSAFSMALFNIQVKKLGQFDVLSMIAYSSIFSTIFLAIISVLFESVSINQIKFINLSTWISIVYMTISTIVGFGLWFWLLQRHSVAKVAPFSLLIPVFGLSFNIIFMHQPITTHLVVGSLVTIFGIAVIIIKK